MSTSKDKRTAARELLENLMSQKLPPNADYGCLDQFELSDEKKKDLTYDDVFWIQLVNKALNGDMKASQEIMDRRFGKAPQYIEQTNVTLSYTDFLSGIAEEEAKTIEMAQPLHNTQVTMTTQPIVGPQVGTNESPVGGGSTVDDLLDDLGLLSPDPEDQ